MSFHTDLDVVVWPLDGDGPLGGAVGVGLGAEVVAVLVGHGGGGDGEQGSLRLRLPRPEARTIITASAD